MANDLEKAIRDALKEEADKVHPANALPIIRKKIKMASRKPKKAEPQWMQDGRVHSEMQAEMRMAELQDNAAKLEICLNNGWTKRANALIERMQNG
jgi:hypothetical protein